MEAYLDADGNSVNSTDGYARIERAYYSAKKLTHEARFDTEGKPVIIADTYASYDKAYDEKGNLTEERYYGTDGKPVMTANGYTRRLRAFDEKAILIADFAGRIREKLVGQKVTKAEGFKANHVLTEKDLAEILSG